MLVISVISHLALEAWGCQAATRAVRDAADGQGADQHERRAARHIGMVRILRSGMLTAIKEEVADCHMIRFQAD